MNGNARKKNMKNVPTSFDEEISNLREFRIPKKKIVKLKQDLQ